MFTSDDLRFVAALSRASSLAAAARELQVTPSAVTQRLQELERRAGLRLVDRSSRRIALTSEGELLARCCARIAPRPPRPRRGGGGPRGGGGGGAPRRPGGPGR